jgi:hypothetical protein
MSLSKKKCVEDDKVFLGRFCSYERKKHNWLQYILLMLYMKIKSFFSFIAICNFYGTKCLDSDDDDDHSAK